jgi:hypothetical protein
VELELSTGVTDTIPCPGWPPGRSQHRLQHARDLARRGVLQGDDLEAGAVDVDAAIRARMRARLSAKSATTTLLAPGLARTCPWAPTSGRMVSAAETASMWRSWKTSVAKRSLPTVAGPWAAPWAGLMR